MIKRFLQWALSKFEDKPAEVWSLPTPAKKPRPQVKKAATKTVAKKATKVVKKAK